MLRRKLEDMPPWVALLIVIGLVMYLALFGPPHQPSDYSSYTNSQHEPENHQTWEIYATIAAAFFTGVLAMFAFIQVRDSRRSAERQLRAYVGVQDIVLDSPNINNPGYEIPNPAPPDFVSEDLVRITIRNDGQTPAFETAVFLNWMPIAFGGRLSLGATPTNYITQMDIEGACRQILDAGKNYAHTVWIRSPLAPFRNALNDRATIIFYGWIEYTDIFETKWVRGFRYVWQPNRIGDDRLYPDREGNVERRAS